MAYKTVQLGVDDEQLARKGLKIKFDVGPNYRISLAGIPGLAEGQPDFSKPPEFAVTERFFHKGLKTFIRYAGPEHDKFLGAEQVKTYCVTPIISWPNVSKSLPPEIQLQVMLSDFVVNLWMLPGKAYRDLRNVAVTYPLAKRDLSVTCTESQYQALTILPMEDSMLEKLFAKRSAEAAQKAINRICEEVKHAQHELVKELGREMTPEQIEAALSGSVGTSAGAGGAGGAGGQQRRPQSMPSTADLDTLLQGITTK